jgi:hypothetical protein
MGVRTYVPSVGRFFKTDPGQDPVNNLDLDGRMWNLFRTFEDQFNGFVKRVG